LQAEHRYPACACER